MKALETGISLHRDPVENNGGGGFHSPGTLRDSRRKALEKEHLSLLAPCEGNVERGSFTGDHECYIEEVSGDRHLFP